VGVLSTGAVSTAAICGLGAVSAIAVDANEVPAELPTEMGAPLLLGLLA